MAVSIQPCEGERKRCPAHEMALWCCVGAVARDVCLELRFPHVWLNPGCTGCTNGRVLTDWTALPECSLCLSEQQAQAGR